MFTTKKLKKSLVRALNCLRQGLIADNSKNALKRLKHFILYFYFFKPLLTRLLRKPPHATTKCLQLLLSVIVTTNEDQVNDILGISSAV